MTALDIILLLIRWAHALAAVVWIGGSLFLLLAGRPALRRTALRQTDAGGRSAPEILGRALAAEFRPIVTTAIGALIVSGVILSAQRLTSDAAGVAYTAFLVAKIALSGYAFGIAWLLPRRRRGDKAARAGAPAGMARRIGTALTGPGALAVIGVVVIGLADVLAWLFERGLAG